MMPPALDRVVKTLPGEGSRGPRSRRRTTSSCSSSGSRKAARRRDCRRRSSRGARTARSSRGPSRPLRPSPRRALALRLRMRRAPKPPRARPLRDRAPPEDRPRSTRRASLRTGASSPSTRRTRREDADLDPAARTPSPRSRSPERRERRGRSGRRTAKFLGFIAEGKLKKIDVSGGPPQKICDAPTGLRRDLEPRGRHPLRRHGHRSDPARVRRRAATPVAVVKPDPAQKETSVGWPRVPSRRHALPLPGDRAEDRGQHVPDRVARLEGDDSSSRRRRRSITYAPPGYLLFVRDRTLVAQPFDAKALKTTGEPSRWPRRSAPTASGSRASPSRATATLAYRTGETADRLALGGPRGKELETVGDPGELREPDALRRRAIVSRSTCRTRAPANATSGSGTSRAASTPGSPSPRRRTSRPRSGRRRGAGSSSPTGNDLRSRREGRRRRRRGEAPPEERRSRRSCRLVARRELHRVLAAQPRTRAGTSGCCRRSATGSRSLVCRPRSTRCNAVFSPDGRFVAYQSNESGRDEIYVQTFPGPAESGRSRTAGGVEPHWRGDGKEIYYRSPDQKLMAVEVRTGATFEAGVPQAALPRPVPPGQSAQPLRSRPPTASGSSSSRRSAATRWRRRRSF